MVLRVPSGDGEVVLLVQSEPLFLRARGAGAHQAIRDIDPQLRRGVFDLAIRRPGRWAALWAVDPTRVPPDDPGLPVWLSIGAAARPLTPAFASTLWTIFEVFS